MVKLPPLATIARGFCFFKIDKMRIAFYNKGKVCDFLYIFAKDVFYDEFNAKFIG